MIEIYHAGRGGGLSPQPWAILVDDNAIIGASAEPRPAMARYGDIHIAALRTVDRMRGFGFVTLGGGEEALLDLPRDGTKPKEGTRLLVQVRREADGGKLARVAERAMLVGHHANIAVARVVDSIVPEAQADVVQDAAAVKETNRFAAAIATIGERVARAKEPQCIWPGRGCVADLLYRFPDFQPVAVRCDSRSVLERLRETLAADSVGNSIVTEYQPEREWRYSKAVLGEMLADALEPRQALPSGGSLLLERCEALTAIDVNTGSAASVAGPERVAIEVNTAAAAGIGRLVRLLNLSGNIVIDFVGMRSKTKQRELVEHLRAAFVCDPAQPWIGSMSPIGLVELSRRYLGPDIPRRFGVCVAAGSQGA